jgi:hypothetical protein
MKVGLLLLTLNIIHGINETRNRNFNFTKKRIDTLFSKFGGRIFAREI